jgi:peptidoglycan hydrolase-like protein with peptidoglycan-binding domain
LRGGSNTGYFGPLTMSAVRSYQTRNGITPASGYVGPKTRAFLNKSFFST